MRRNPDIALVLVSTDLMRQEEKFTHYATVNLHDSVYHVDAGISGAKTGDGEDTYEKNNQRRNN